LFQQKEITRAQTSTMKLDSNKNVTNLHNLSARFALRISSVVILFITQSFSSWKTWNPLFCSYVDNVSAWRQFLTFSSTVSNLTKHILQVQWLIMSEKWLQKGQVTISDCLPDRELLLTCLSSCPAVCSKFASPYSRLPQLRGENRETPTKLDLFIFSYLMLNKFLSDLQSLWETLNCCSFPRGFAN